MGITVIYTFLIIVIFWASNIRDEKAHSRSILLSGLILAFVSGFRSIWVGTSDTYIYSLDYAECARMPYKQIAEHFNKDIFYYYTNHFVATVIRDDFHALLLVFAILYMGCLAYLLRKESDNPLVSFIVFITMGYFSFQMNGVRQGLAMAFLMLAYIPLKRRKWLPFLFLVFCGYLFHGTSLVFLIAYPLSYIPLNKKAIFAYSAVVVISLVYGQELLNSFVEDASNYDARFEMYKTYQAKLNYSGLIQLLLFAIVSFRYYNSVIKKDASAVYLYMMLILSIIFQSMAVFIAELFRVSMYFNIFLVLLLPKVFDAMPASNRRLYSVGLCGLLLVYFFFFGAGTTPYHFYWND